MTINNKRTICPMLCQDEPTKIAHLGARCFYTILAFFALGIGVSAGDGYFVSMGIFASSLFMEYLRFKPSNVWRKIAKIAGKIINGLWCFIAIVGLIGVIIIVKNGEVYAVTVSRDFIFKTNLSVDLLYIWCALGLSPFITLVDWLIYQSPIEEKLADSPSQISV